MKETEYKSPGKFFEIPLPPFEKEGNSWKKFFWKSVSHFKLNLVLFQPSAHTNLCSKSENR